MLKFLAVGLTATFLFLAWNSAKVIGSDHNLHLILEVIVTFFAGILAISRIQKYEFTRKLSNFLDKEELRLTLEWTLFVAPALVLLSIFVKWFSIFYE